MELAQDRKRYRGYCNKSNDPSGSIKRGEFLDQLRNCTLLEEDSAPCSLAVAVSCSSPGVIDPHNRGVGRL